MNERDVLLRAAAILGPVAGDVADGQALYRKMLADALTVEADKRCVHANTESAVVMVCADCGLVI